MKRTLLWAIASGLLLAVGLLLYVAFAYRIGRPDEAAAARELRGALTVYAEFVLYKGLLPQLLVTLTLYPLLDRIFDLKIRGRLAIAAGVASCAALAGLLVATTLMRTEIFDLPAAVYTGPANFTLTVLQLTAAVTAAMLIPRFLLPGVR